MSLLAEKRFAGIFWTQSVGAFADNLYKQSLVALVAVYGLTWMGLDKEQIALASGALFMAPFFLLSATAGQLADRYDKAMIIRRLKVAEIFFSTLGAFAVYYQHVLGCLVVLLFFGVQATFFGPLKYSILPQLLLEEELVSGNAWVEMSTNVFILVGTILGTLMVEKLPLYWVGALLLSLGIVGYLCSRMIPPAPSQYEHLPADQQLQVEWNPLRPTWRIIKLVAEQRAVLNSILGISWFWVLGLVMLTGFNFYAQDVLHSELEVSTLLFAIFSIGIAVGSMLCERLSYGRLELGLVPFGSIGITVFLGALWLMGSPLPQPLHPYSVPEFLSTQPGVLICMCVFLFCVFSGFFIVPLYTLIQQRCAADVRSRVIAGNNIINAFFMVLGMGFLALLKYFELSWPQIFGVMAILNAMVAIHICTLIPEFFLRFIAYLIAHFMYRLKVVNEHKIPDQGGVILICNHVSFADWLLLAAAVRRPIHFVMWYTYAELPLLRFLFRGAGVIPISSARLRPKILEAAFRQIKEYLDGGDVVCIFPEGQITKTGDLMPFRNGVERMVEDSPVPVVPMALRGLWGSNFSRYRGGFWKRFVRRPLRSPIEVVVGEPIRPEDVQVEKLQELVRELRGDRL